MPNENNKQTLTNPNPNPKSERRQIINYFLLFGVNTTNTVNPRMTSSSFCSTNIYFILFLSLATSARTRENVYMPIVSTFLNLTPFSQFSKTAK